MQNAFDDIKKEFSELLESPTLIWKRLFAYWQDSPKTIFARSDFSWWRIYWMFAGKNDVEKERKWFQPPIKSSMGIFSYFLRLPIELIFALLLSLLASLMYIGVGIFSLGMKIFEDPSEYCFVSINPIKLIIGNLIILVSPFVLVAVGIAVAAAATAAFALTFALNQLALTLMERMTIAPISLLINILTFPLTLLDYYQNKDKVTQIEPHQSLGSTHAAILPIISPSNRSSNDLQPSPIVNAEIKLLSGKEILETQTAHTLSLLFSDADDANNQIFQARSAYSSGNR